MVKFFAVSFLLFSSCSFQASAAVEEINDSKVEIHIENLEFKN